MEHRLQKMWEAERQISFSRPRMSLDAEQEKAKQKEDDVIYTFLQTRDLPQWFRGSSIFQLKAADELFNAIRDDAEQKTTHRVLACLNSIGLSPLICKKDIRQLIKLSRGNDLAFLWFLMELHYKSKGPGYNRNESIIITMIAHLDMITTLRELDRILPPPQLPKAQIERLKKIEERKATKLAKSRLSKKPKIVPELPYFQKQVRPKPFGKPLSIPMPGFVSKLNQYHVYKDPNHVVANESNRWYVKYRMQTGGRIVKKILNEEISRICDIFEKISIKSNTVEVLCQRHKLINELEKKLETELKIIARDRCLKNLDTDANRKKATRERICNQLDRDVAMYMCKFRKHAEKTRRVDLYHVLAREYCEEEDEKSTSDLFEACFGAEEYGSCESDGSRQNSCEEEQTSEGNILKKAEKAMEVSIRADLKADAEKRVEKEKVAKKLIRKQNRLMAGESCDSSSKTTSDGSNDQSGKHVRIKSLNRGRISYSPRESEFGISRLSSFAAKYLRNYSYGSFDVETPTPSQTFFEGPREHRPYHFDYRKIFRFKKNNYKSINIKKAFVKALDSDVALLNRLMDTPPDYHSTVNNCVHKMWKEQVALKNEKMELEEEEEKERLFNEKNKVKNTPLNYDQDYYDPDDTELLNKMLKDGLDHLAQSPKYVLASLPGSEKLPILRQWIYNRFGKVYSRAQRWKSFRLSLKIYRALEKIMRDVPTPNYKLLGDNKFVSYSCRNTLLEKGRLIKNLYYKNLDDQILLQARILWYVMMPYMCFNGPPRATYYAYMPSHSKDIKRFRTWKTTEFMNAKVEWEKRKKLKNMTNT